MTPDHATRRIALLLNSLGAEVSDIAIEGLAGTQAGSVKSILRDFADKPPSTAEINRTLDEFESFMKFALQSANSSSSLADYLADDNEPDSAEARNSEARPELAIFTPTDDPEYDLQQMTAAQIAGAIKDEHFQTIGLVLSCLPKELLAEAVDLLPHDKQAQAFFASQQKSSVNPELIGQILRKTAEKASLIEPAGSTSEDEDQNTAELLRALPKATRKRLMTELEEVDAEKSARIQDLLYLFKDIATYDNRSIQKLLGQADTDVLVVAMQDIEQEISDRIFENLSKRAAGTLKEEMEFRKTSSDEEVEAARDQIAKLIAQLDRNGDLNER